MTIFVLACLLLLMFSGLFLLLPFGANSRVEDPVQANLNWYQRRRAELEGEGDEELLEDARLRLLEDEPQQPPPQSTAVESSDSRLRWLLIPLVAVAAAFIYYQLGGAQDVLIAQRLQGLDESSSAQEMESLMLAIEERAGERPANLHYAALLGRYYMGQQDYRQAAETYTELVSRAPGDAQMLAYAAQAQYLAAGRELDDKSRMLAEQALAVDPLQRTALGLLGMASFEQGSYRAAIAYWERLLAQDVPGSESAQMIGSVIAMARQKLGEAGEPPIEPQVVAQAGPGVTVTVTLPEDADAGADDTVFVLARNADSDSRMPIAVQRLSVAQLPVTLRLDDGNSMAGQKLSEFESVLVLVQVSPGGRPGEASATWLGQAGPLAPSADTTAIPIELRRNQP